MACHRAVGFPPQEQAYVQDLMAEGERGVKCQIMITRENLVYFMVVAVLTSSTTALDCALLPLTTWTPKLVKKTLAPSSCPRRLRLASEPIRAWTIQHHRHQHRQHKHHQHLRSKPPKPLHLAHDAQNRMVDLLRRRSGPTIQRLRASPAFPS